MRRGACTRAWGLVVVALGATAATSTAHAARLAPETSADPVRPSAPAPVDPATEAKAALQRAREAARAQDYETALHHYERARALQPSASLHFNIAVCHHRLMLAEPAGSEPYEQRRAAAVEAYNRYLQVAPHAEDREDVAALVRALGGTPLTDDPEPWTIELVEPDEVPDPPGFDDGGATVDGGAGSNPTGDATDAGTDAPDPPDDTDDADAPTSVPPTPVPGSGSDPDRVAVRGRFGPFLPLLLVNPAQLSASDALRPTPTLGIGLRGNAFIGPRRRVALGGELGWTTQPISARTQHRLQVGYLGVLVEVRHPLGPRERLEIGGGGVVGLGTQALVYGGDDPLRCSDGREASRRNGLWASGRLSFAARLGREGLDELSLRLGPGLGAFGPGSQAPTDADGMSCEDEPTAFDRFGIDRATALVVTFDIGYARRF